MRFGPDKRVRVRKTQAAGGAGPLSVRRLGRPRASLGTKSRHRRREMVSRIYGLVPIWSTLHESHRELLITLDKAPLTKAIGY